MISQSRSDPTPHSDDHGNMADGETLKGCFEFKCDLSDRSMFRVTRALRMEDIGRQDLTSPESLAACATAQSAGADWRACRSSAGVLFRLCCSRA